MIPRLIYLLTQAALIYVTFHVRISNVWNTPSTAASNDLMLQKRVALTLRWKWLLHKTYNLVIRLPLNQCSNYEAISVAKWKGCVIKHRVWPHPCEGGHPLTSWYKFLRVAVSHRTHKRKTLPLSVFQLSGRIRSLQDQPVSQLTGQGQASLRAGPEDQGYWGCSAGTD